MEMSLFYFPVSCGGTNFPQWTPWFLEIKRRATPMFEQPSSLPRIKTLHLMLGPEAKVYPGVNVSYLGLFPSGCGWCFSLAWRRLVPCRTVLEGILKVVYHVCLRLGNSSPRAVLLNRMSIFLLNSAAHSSPHVDPHFRLFFFNSWTCPWFTVEGGPVSLKTSHILLFNSCFQRPVILTPTQVWK